MHEHLANDLFGYIKNPPRGSTRGDAAETQVAPYSPRAHRFLSVTFIYQGKDDKDAHERLHGLKILSLAHGNVAKKRTSATGPKRRHESTSSESPNTRAGDAPEDVLLSLASSIRRIGRLAPLMS